MRPSNPSMKSVSAAPIAAAAVAAPAQDDTHVVLVEVRRGVTVLSDGDPVAGAVVATVRPGQGPQEIGPEAIRTDADGRAALSGVRGDCTVLVSGPGIAPVVQYVRAPARGGTAAATVALGARTDAAVRAVDPSGAAGPGAEVSLVVVMDVLGRPPAGSERRKRSGKQTDE